MVAVSAALLALVLVWILPDRAQAITMDNVALTDFGVGAQTDGNIQFTLDSALLSGDTITLTFPAGWTVQAGALTAGNWTGLDSAPTSVTGNAGARTVAIVLGGNQDTTTVPLQISGSTELVNPSGTASGLSILVDGTGLGQGSSIPFSITGSAATGGTVTLSSTVAGAQTAGTVAFTLGSPVASGQSLTLTFPTGWTIQNGALTAGNWTGLDSAPASVTGASSPRTVTIVLGGAQTTLGVTLTISASAQMTNRTTVGTGLTITVEPPGQTSAATSTFAVIAGAPSQIDVTGPASVAAGVASTNITITVQDQFGNTANTTQNTTFTLASNSGGTVTFNPVSPVTVTSGTSSVTFTYTDSAAGSRTITATRASGDTVGADTLSITVTQVAHAGNSTVSASPTSVVADGTTTSTVTVTLRDAINNAVPGKTVTLAAGSGSSTVSAASGVSNGSGVVTFTVKNSTAEAVTYTTTDTTDSVTVTATATVTFTSAATSVTGVTIAVSSGAAGGGSVATATFTTSSSGALTAGDTITVQMTGYTFTVGTITVTPGGGLSASVAGSTAVGQTSKVVVTLGAGAVIASSTKGTVSFPVSNPAAGTVAKAGLTVATSKDTVATASSADIVISAPPPITIPTPIPTPSPTPTPTPSPTPTAGGATRRQPTVILANEVSKPTSSTGASTVTTNGVGSASDDTITVSIPAGAMPGQATVSVGVITNSADLKRQVPPPRGIALVLPLQITATTADGAAVTDNFASPVTIEIEIPDIGISGDLVMAFWNGSRWVEVNTTATLNPATGKLVLKAVVNHFTVFAVMETPGRGTFQQTIAPSGITGAIWRGGTVDQMRQVVPTARTIWAYDGVQSHLYLPGAPEFVNREFNRVFEDGLVSAGTIVYVVLP